MSAVHAHHHGGGDHHRHGASSARGVLLASLAITLSFAVIEALAGWWAGSLALLGDAGHMVTDSAALAVGAAAAWIGTLPPSSKHSYGLARAEVMGALINVLIMFAIVAAITWEAVQRLRQPVPVAGAVVAVVAAVGLLLNLAVAWLLHRGEQDMNVRGAMLHVLGDLLGSVAAMVSGTVIWLSGWTLIDPLLSMLISALILASSLRLLRDVLHVLMEGVPRDIDLAAVGSAVAGAPGVQAVHDLHIWSLGSRQYALSAHITIGRLQDWPGILARLQTLLSEQFGISHTTLQPELVSGEGCGEPPCGDEYLA